MTWHLKDKELEKVLEKYSDGNFVKALNFAIERDWIDAANVVTVEFERKFLSRGYTNDLSFRTDELKEVHEYNPKAWNEFPKVKPPYNVMMRVETYFGQGYKLSYNHFNDGDFWCDPNCILMSGAFSDSVARFRPWSED